MVSLFILVFKTVRFGSIKTRFSNDSYCVKAFCKRNFAHLIFTVTLTTPTRQTTAALGFKDKRNSRQQRERINLYFTYLSRPSAKSTETSKAPSLLHGVTSADLVIQLFLELVQLVTCVFQASEDEESKGLFKSPAHIRNSWTLILKK